MLSENLLDLIESIARSQCESQTIEVKAAHMGCPKRLYDTLSSFSNQDDGGTIVFGLDEEKEFEAVGVYDVQDLQKHVTEQCAQMQPPVRAVFTRAAIGERDFISAEIPGCDVSDRPCFYRGKGRLKGSYVRVGGADEPMTEYEIYSYEAFRHRYQDEAEQVSRATCNSLDSGKIAEYLTSVKVEKPNLTKFEDDEILELMSITRNGVPTVAGVMMFSLFPQAYFPQLAIIATVVPGDEDGAIDEVGNRFLDNKRIEGTLPELLSGAMSFVRSNTRRATRIDSATGQRADRDEYPLEAVRELVLNALIHRDYGVHTQGMPIRLTIYSGRLVVASPGGLYGRLKIDDLGKVRPDTRNPVIATTMEVLRETENRYSGIPTIRRLMKEARLPAPTFEDRRGEFVAVLRNGDVEHGTGIEVNIDLEEAQRRIALFCVETPRTRAEIAQFMGVQTSYVMRRYVKPLVEKGVLVESIPETPRSPHQRYVTAERLITQRS